jgi:hypothetical protein
MKVPEEAQMIKALIRSAARSKQMEIPNKNVKAMTPLIKAYLDVELYKGCSEYAIFRGCGGITVKFLYSPVGVYDGEYGINDVFLNGKSIFETSLQELDIQKIAGTISRLNEEKAPFTEAFVEKYEALAEANENWRAGDFTTSFGRPAKDEVTHD